MLAGALPEELADDVERGRINGIEEDDAMRGALSLELQRRRSERIEMSVSDEADEQTRLPREVMAQVRLRHGCNRVAAHGMAVDAMDIAVGSCGEELAFEDEAAQVRSAYDDGHEGRVERGDPELDSATDASVLWRGIKGGADLVLRDGSME